MARCPRKRFSAPWKGVETVSFASILRRLEVVGLVVAAALMVGAVVGAALASADSTSEYGEVTRFGGFDGSAFNGERYGGPLTPGKFLDPTGFAVDPQDNTVYVVDRTSSYAENPTSWRIQQFSPEGVVLGTTTFTLPNSNFGAYAIMGLAVDHSAGRLYALVVGSPPSSTPNKLVPVARELLAWSTTADSSAELIGAPGLASDPMHTTGGLVSTAAQLLSAPRPLFAPQGIAIDRLEAPGVDNPVVIEASDLLPGGAGNPIRGNTVVQQVATQPQGGKGIGDLLSSWSGTTVAETLGASWGPLGISTNPDGTLTVLLDASNLSATDVYVVKLKADLSEPHVLNSDAVEPPIYALDQAAMWIDESPFVTVAGVGVSNTAGAGPEVAQLSTKTANDANGLYAADFFSTRPIDQQFSPEAGGPEYWLLETPGTHESNIGVRLLRPAADEAISDPIGATIVNTLGDISAHAPCHVGAPEAVLAAGADGTLWVLDRGPQSIKPGANGAGRQIIELAPGAGRPCRQPSGTFTMTPAGGVEQSGEETLTVPAGTEVTFEAGSLIREGVKPFRTFAKPFAYEWDLDGNGANGPRHDGFETVRQMQPPEYYWPSSSVTYTYVQPGRYTVRARLHSDYGAYTTPPATIIVTSAIHPEAKFTATVTPGSQQVTFNAASSSAGVGSIANYHWSWGDGSGEDEGSGAPIVTHTYLQPGVYDVTLTVINTSYQKATSARQAVTVVPVGRPAVAEVVDVAGPLYGIPPALYPIPSSPSGKTVAHLSARAHFAGSALSVMLFCPATAGSCAGTVRIETASAFAAASGRGRRARRRLLLGHASFTVRGGGHRVVSVRLSAKGIALLRKLRRLPVLIAVSAHGSPGDLGITRLWLTLRATSPARHRRS